MNAPIAAAGKPCLVELRAGRPYNWCACGRSAREPFCGVMRRWLLQAARRLSNEGSGTAVHDGGCYVCTVDSAAFLQRGALRLVEAIGAGAGARFLSQYVIELDNGASEIFRFAASDAVLFAVSGSLQLTISGRRFDLSAEDSAFILAGEAVQLENRGRSPVKLLMTACPQPEGPEWLDAMPANFDSSLPERVFSVDPSKREPMADRFYQVLIGEETGSKEVTQFIGEIPRSRAAAHHHLYEEAILILSGEGYMWTENARAAVAPGDIIFLPRKQLHSLECASPGGMRLMGAFYPSGSPAVNY